jgi:beta-galactosidase
MRMNGLRAAALVAVSLGLCQARCGHSEGARGAASAGGSGGGGSSSRPDGGEVQDATDSGDAGTEDAGAEDAGMEDAGMQDGGGPDGGPLASAVPLNRYDGARATTLGFDASWKFHLGDVNGAQAPAYNDSSWTTLDVPHDWSIGLPFNQASAAGSGGGYLDGGVGWYRKSFSLPATAMGQKVFIQFDGVYMDSTVWMNGTQICARPYGYVSYECDFTSVAKFGASNVLAVRANNQLPSSRWYSGSGIYRHVWLKTVNPVRVAYTGTRVTTPQVSASSTTVALTVSVQNDGPSAEVVTVSTSIRDASMAQITSATAQPAMIGAGKTSDVMQSFTVPNPELWSPSSPTMYSVVTTISANGNIVDAYTTPLGIRSFTFDAKTGFSLNGQPMKLNGVCNHHDLGALGAAVNHRAIEKRLQVLKTMGVNALRTSHNPPAPELLDLADSLGLLVMDEAFDTWDQAKVKYDYARFFSQWSTTDISAHVARDRNHPSVIIWSIGNEIADDGNHAIAQSLIAAVKAEDSTRPIGQAFLEANPDTGTANMEDVVGLNYAPYTYDSWHGSQPTWKLFASESSSAVRSRGVYKLPANQNILTSSDNQCSSYDNSVVAWGTSAEGSWQSINSRAFMAGEFIWTGFDYIGEPTPYGWPSKSSYFGAIDTAGFPKDIFYFYQSRWNYSGPTMVHIAPMDWTSWTAAQSVPIYVYSNADSVELFLNGKSLGSQNVVAVASQAKSGHLEWSVAFSPGTLEAKATKNGTVVATDTVQTAGAPAAVVLKVDRASITADGLDLAYVEADIVDSKGVLVPQASNVVSFSITGPGKIVGVDNGNPISHEAYQGTTRAAFSGKALAIIQSTTTPGMVTVEASSGSGLSAGSVMIATGP